MSVDLALCLAIDVSASVDFDEFGLMIGGYAAAFRDPALAAALAAGPRGATAVSALFWSGAATPPDIAVPWMRIDGVETAGRFAGALEAAPRLPRPGATALGEAMAAGLALLARCPHPAARLVLDVSGDGPHNQGRHPSPVRDLAVAAGVVVNALAVINEEGEDLVAHYRDAVIGGPGSFVLACADYSDFAAAIRLKLLREAGYMPPTA